MDATSLPNPVQVPTLSVPNAGHLIYGLSRAASYEAARRGDLPTIRCGNRLRVPTAECWRLVGLEPPNRIESDAA
jgi:hypothetical protein